eukprot:m.479898 g.479898  ORF g.479898 m.479898 type:complete len:78 (+) comp21628_c0_seq1:1083-1316(+)
MFCSPCTAVVNHAFSTHQQLDTMADRKAAEASQSTCPECKFVTTNPKYPNHEDSCKVAKAATAPKVTKVGAKESADC